MYLQAAKQAAWELWAGVKETVPEVIGADVVVGGIAADVIAMDVVFWALAKTKRRALETMVVRRRISDGLLWNSVKTVWQLLCMRKGREHECRECSDKSYPWTLG